MCAHEIRRAEFRSILGGNCLCSGRDFYRAVPAMLPFTLSCPNYPSVHMSLTLTTIQGF